MKSCIKWCLFELNDVLLCLVWTYMLKVASFMNLYALDDDFHVKLNQTREQDFPVPSNSPRRVEGQCRASEPCQTRPGKCIASWGRVGPVAPDLAHCELVLSSPVELISHETCLFLENMMYMLILWLYYDPIIIKWCVWL
jgi:hypothetical protein